MTVLVADVGGTNARLALAPGGELAPDSIRHFKNARHRTFYDVVEAYLASTGTGRVEACVVALAGPTTPDRGRLTNFPWSFDTAELNGVAGSGRSLLINDLTALGYSLSGMPEGMTRRLCGDTDAGSRNGQSLVAGFGTGFNVCPVKRTGQAICCFEAEAGHTSPNDAVTSALRERLGSRAAAFDTVEKCFAGPGLSQLYGAFTGGASLDGEAIVDACRSDPSSEAAAFVEWVSGLLGAFCQHLVLQYMPLDGLYLAGSVGRGVFSCGYLEPFTAALNAHDRFGALLTGLRVSVIEDDTAPLIGCAEAARMLAR